MPATSQAQQMAAGMDLQRIREGRRPRTFKGASVETIREFAETRRKGLPKRARRRKIAEIRSAA